MSRQRRRAIERRIADLRERDQARLTALQLLDDMVELEEMHRELSTMLLRNLTSRRRRSPAEARLCEQLSRRLAE